MHTKTSRLVLLSLLLSLALILSYVESFIPMPLPIPGAKLGLPNIVTMISLILLNWPLTLLLVIARVILSGFLFGNMFSIIYSLCGGLLSLLIMTLLNRRSFSIILVSVFGSIFHNFGQLLVAALVLQNLNLIFSYFPVLMLIAIPTGIVTGTAARGLLSLLKKTPYFKNIREEN
ncbi:Gx transporter family protein [Eubacteriaceae bacterium ES3]|nr:Gx transporter family protein [Eubacteriaceae bacterium ES3]